MWSVAFMQDRPTSHNCTLTWAALNTSNKCYSWSGLAQLGFESSLKTRSWFRVTSLSWTEVVCHAPSFCHQFFFFFFFLNMVYLGNVVLHSVVIALKHRRQTFVCACAYCHQFLLNASGRYSASPGWKKGGWIGEVQSINLQPSTLTTELLALAVMTVKQAW